MKKSSEELKNLTFDERFNILSQRERKYFNIMKSVKGVLFITSKPGMAKSSIAKEIARVMGYDYLDIRLSIADETDFGMPKLKEISVDGTMLDVHNMTVPEWAILANQRPTIIHFEELNRCSLQVRNACLGILLERTIGPKFQFNKDVLMIASGNLGDEDGTDVDDFDSALNNRLIHMKHELNLDEWIQQFAKDNIHPIIVSFLKNKSEYFYRKAGADNGVQERAFATPRTWEMLSEYILNTSSIKREDQMNGKYDVNEIKSILSDVGHAIVGTSISGFTKYLEESMRLTINDILDNFNKKKEELSNVNRDKKSELLLQLKEMDLKKLKEKQIKNLISFLEIIDEDERAGFLTDILDEKMEDENICEPYKTILLSFKDIMSQIGDMS